MNNINAREYLKIKIRNAPLVPHLRTGGVRGESLGPAAGTAEGRGPTGRSSAFSFFRDPAMSRALYVHALSYVNEQPVKWIR
ncbi:hypothetical protein CSAL01_10735 [Colletotrichum salicis]|uniref:Uncharacterized protein n=1 Tax=Colletotrichum salicis TaxID=1209931 RepID=A0A135V1Q1_9PEZI|nr:hypothetical protein CSAL01_10735 [Colletotrichum salicis]